MFHIRARTEKRARKRMRVPANKRNNNRNHTTNNNESADDWTQNIMRTVAEEKSPQRKWKQRTDRPKREQKKRTHILYTDVAFDRSFEKKKVYHGSFRILSVKCGFYFTNVYILQKKKQKTKNTSNETKYCDKCNLLRSFASEYSFSVVSILSYFEKWLNEKCISSNIQQIRRSIFTSYS